jgi:diaminopropionate ammonia-lyase
MDAADWFANPHARSYVAQPVPGEVFSFHQRLAGYGPAALRELPELAAEMGVGRVFAKEEPLRLGLPASKIMGASWAVCRALAEHAGETRLPRSLEDISPFLAGIGELSLVAATDGNHGRAVARMARMLGLGAEIFVPAEISRRAKDGIAGEGAVVTELDAPYDDVVRAAAARVAEGTVAAAEYALDPSTADLTALLIQDRAWPGYERVPTWIVEGYSTIFREIDLQLAEAGVQRIDAVATPVGAGLLAQAAVQHYRRQRRGQRSRHRGRARGDAGPSLLSVEPRGAACLLESLKAGRPTSVETGRTMLAGLDCGTVSLTAWPDLRGGTDAAVAIADEQAARAVADLGRLKVDSGPCGATSLAGLRRALGEPVLREAMGVTGQSAVVLLCTEDTAATPMD